MVTFATTTTVRYYFLLCLIPSAILSNGLPSPKVVSKPQKLLANIHNYDQQKLSETFKTLNTKITLQDSYESSGGIAVKRKRGENFDRDKGGGNQQGYFSKWKTMIFEDFMSSAKRKGFTTKELKYAWMNYVTEHWYKKRHTSSPPSLLSSPQSHSTLVSSTSDVGSHFLSK